MPQPAKNARAAFTLIEMLVVVGIIGVLAAMILPALSLAREAARNSQCQRNLQQIGIGMQVLADKNHERFCSGAFDWMKDGAVTETGWVADLVNSGVPVGKMLCPSNEGLAAETYADLLDQNAAGWSASCGVSLVGSAPSQLPDGSMQKNPCRVIIETFPSPSEGRRKFIEDKIFNRFYNTNFTASWFLVRSEALIDEVTGNVTTQYGPACGTELSLKNTTRGPLRRAATDTARVSSSLVPLLGDGAPTNRSLSSALGQVSAGTLLIASMTKGPLLKEDVPSAGSALEVPSFGGGVPKATWWGVWNDKVLQDYRRFAPVHRGTCNILFADGSVRDFKDVNRDGALNNGFGAVGGFANDQLEVNPSDLFSQYSIDAIQK